VHSAETSSCSASSVSSTTSAFFKLLLAGAWAWQQAVVLTGLERTGKGLRSAPRDAIISDSMPDRRGRGFGIHRAFDTAGAIFGSILAFVLVWKLEMSLKNVILIAAVAAFLSLVPIIFVREKRRQPSDARLRLSLRQLPGSLKTFIFAAGIFGLADVTFMFFILRAKTAFTPEWQTAGPILLYILFNTVYAALAVPLGILSDKIGHRNVIVGGYFVFGLTSFGFAIFSTLPAYIVLFTLYGMVKASIEGNQRAFVSDLSASEVRGTALGTYHTITGLTALPGSVIAGLLGEATPATFIYAGSVSFLAVIVFLALRRRMR